MSGGEVVLADQGTLSLVAELEQAGAMDAVHLALEDPDLPFERYEALGTFLGRVQDGSRWWIGDWLVFGEHVYGEKYAQAAEQIGLTPGTLQNYAYVASKVVKEQRRPELPFSTHREVAALEPDDQRSWLQRAIDEGLTRAQLAALIRPPALAPPGVGTSAPNPGVSFESQIREIGFAILRDAKQEADHWIVPDEDIARLRAVLHDH